MGTLGQRTGSRMPIDLGVLGSKSWSAGHSESPARSGVATRPWATTMRGFTSSKSQPLQCNAEVTASARVLNSISAHPEHMGPHASRPARAHLAGENAVQDSGMQTHNGSPFNSSIVFILYNKLRYGVCTVPGWNLGVQRASINMPATPRVRACRREEPCDDNQIGSPISRGPCLLRTLSPPRAPVVD